MKTKKFIKGRIYEFPARPDNKPPTLARRAEFKGRLEDGRHEFMILEVQVNGTWMDLDEAAARLKENGSTRSKVHRVIRGSGKHMRDIRLVSEAGMQIAGKQQAPTKEPEQAGISPIQLFNLARELMGQDALFDAITSALDGAAKMALLERWTKP